MKKFKHKVTGKEVTKAFCEYLTETESIPSWVVESSNDWEEIIDVKDVKKSKTPIFRTEDGVDVFEGDKYWWVGKEFVVYSGLVYTNCGSTKGLKYFSTEEKAKEWVVFNKPCLSLMDMKRHGYGIEFIYLLAERRNKPA